MIAALAIATPLLAVFSDVEGDESLWELLQRAWLLGDPFVALQTIKDGRFRQEYVGNTLRNWVESAWSAEEYAERWAFAMFFLNRMGLVEDDPAERSFSSRKVFGLWKENARAEFLSELVDDEIDVLYMDELIEEIERQQDERVNREGCSIVSYDDDFLFLGTETRGRHYPENKIYKVKRPSHERAEVMRQNLKQVFWRRS